MEEEWLGASPTPPLGGCHSPGLRPLHTYTILIQEMNIFYKKFLEAEDQPGKSEVLSNQSSSDKQIMFSKFFVFITDASNSYYNCDMYTP